MKLNLSKGIFYNFINKRSSSFIKLNNYFTKSKYFYLSILQISCKIVNKTISN